MMKRAAETRPCVVNFPDLGDGPLLENGYELDSYTPWGIENVAAALTENSAPDAPASGPYTQEVRSIDVLLVPCVGAESDARMFLRLTGHDGRTRETLIERLNDPTSPFLPVETTGHVEFVHKRWISHVVSDGPSPEVEKSAREGWLQVPITLELCHGDVLRGEVHFARPVGSNRLSDHLNSPDTRFLLLSTSNHTYYVNRDAVHRARP